MVKSGKTSGLEILVRLKGSGVWSQRECTGKRGGVSERSFLCSPEIKTGQLLLRVT